MLVLRKWIKGMTPRNICFTHIPLWVQVWGLPFELLNEEVAQDIGKGLGIVVDIDNLALNSDQACFLRIRVDIPLSNHSDEEDLRLVQRVIKCGLPLNTNTSMAFALPVANSGMR